MVRLFIVHPPVRVLPQYCVNPRKSTVELPHESWPAVGFVKRTSFVFCSLIVSLYSASRCFSSARTLLASSSFAQVMRMSSANLTMLLRPVNRGFISSSNHPSTTWCRKMFDSIGETTEPCGVPVSSCSTVPWSTTPALSRCSISRRSPPSFTRFLITPISRL